MFASLYRFGRRAAASLLVCLVVLLGSAGRLHADPDSTVDDMQSFTLSAGGVHQAGNTQVLTGNAGLQFQLVRGPYWFDIAGAWIYSENIRDGETIAHNAIGRMRHDLFFTDYTSLWAIGGIRWDRFAGLDPSLQGAGGLSAHFVRLFDDEDQMLHRFWFEGGVDVTANWYDYSIVGGTGPDMETLYSVRLFLAWQKVINDDLTLRAAAEALINIENADDSRYNGEIAASTGIGGDFQAELLFRILVDTLPQGDAEEVDTITQLNILYTVD